MDDQRYNEKWATITWEKSSMRSWINGYKASENQSEIDYSNKNFIDTAFSTAQKNAIKTTKVENRNNIHYGSAGQGGNDTSDKIFLLSEREVYNTDVKSVYLIATRDLRISGCNFFYLKIKGLCDFLRKRF